MADESPKPWERQPGESSKAFRAFTIYRDMGPARSVKQAYREYTGKHDFQGDVGKARYFQKWNIGTGWVKRAEAYDAHIERLTREAEEEALRQSAGRWAIRMEELREAEYQAGISLLQKATKMLEFPLEQVVEKNGGQTIIHVPADWKVSDAVNLLKAASMLQRLAIGQDAVALPAEDANDTKQKMIVAGKTVYF